MNLEILKAQLEVKKAYIAYFQARIISGAYKSRKVHHGSAYGLIKDGDTETMGFTGELFTEEELLQDEIGIMKRHIHDMNDLVCEIAGLVSVKSHTNSPGPG